MYIFQESETPQGVAATVHRVQKLEVTQGRVIVTLNSYANESAELIVWQDQYEIPMVVFSAGNYPQNIYDYFTGPNGPFSGAATIAEMDELEKLKLTKKVSVNTLREREIAKGCTTPAGVVDTDEESVRNIMAAYQTAALAKVTNSPFQINWRLANNEMATLDADAMIAVGNAVMARTQACYENSWTLKSQIGDAVDVEGVEGVLIADGWPAI